jgi:hypothetical protein
MYILVTSEQMSLCTELGPNLRKEKLNLQSGHKIVGSNCEQLKLSIHSFIHQWLYSPFIGLWPLLQFRNLFYMDGRTSWRGISPSQGSYLHTGQHKHRINAHANIHALSGIQTHDHSFRANEDGSCLRPRGHCDRP